MTPRIQAFDHLHVFVPDRAAAEAWYRDVLGFTRVPELAFWADDGGPLTLRDAGANVHLALFERPAQPCRSTLALRVGAADFVRWQTHLALALGQAPRVQDHQVSKSIYFSDLAGNPFEITTYELPLPG